MGVVSQTLKLNEQPDLLHDATNSGKFKVGSMVFGQVWSFSS